MKDDNSNQKENNEKLKQENTNNIISSSEKEQCESYIDKFIYPDQALNQKFFPNKENYFGIKNMNIIISPSQSPILNYYAGLSPKKEELNNNNDFFINSSNNFSGKLSPYFNSNPSKFSNDQNPRKDTIISLNNNNNSNINEEESKTLQKKMEPLLRKTDYNNNFIKKSSLPLNNFEEKIEKQFEDNKDREKLEDNEETFTLTTDNFGEVLIKEQNLIKENEILQTQKKQSTDGNLINNLSIIKNSGHIENFGEKNNNESQSSENKILQNNDSLVENIINKKEFKPYIPHIYRNKSRYLKNTQNPNEQEINNNNESNQKEVYQDFTNYNLENITHQKTEQHFRFCKNNIDMENNNKFSMKSKNDFDDENLYNNFYYNGDYYKINNKEYKKKDYLKPGEIPSISSADIVTTITSNNKKIKRIDPNTYLNESIEYLSYNIFPLAKDQSGCRFLQEKLENDPASTIDHFYKSIIPYILPLSKDQFGNYLIQKLFYFLPNEKIQRIMEIISSSILDIGVNTHGTRVLQQLINFLSTKQLVNLFLSIIKPYIIPLLKDLNGAHFFFKFVNYHPECADEINKIIIENCSILATHRHGCCILQKIINGSDKNLRDNLINNLIDKCFVLIIDQFGNYIIQSILSLNKSKFCEVIVMKIIDNIAYYCKNRYSSNVIEKCFDYCGKKEKKKLIEKMSNPEILSELIVDEHGNYVVQKSLYYADSKDKEKILNIIKSLIPRIKSTTFGEKLLFKLNTFYPELNYNDYINEKNSLINSNKNIKNKEYKKKKKTNYYNNYNNEYNKFEYYNDFSITNHNGIINNKIENNNFYMNNYYIIHNNTINIKISPNSINILDNKTKNSIDINSLENNLININQNGLINIDNNNNNSTSKKKKKKKKGKKKKKIDERDKNKINSNKEENNSNIDINSNNYNIFNHNQSLKI